MPLTPAERQKKYRERLKNENPDKYEALKKKVAARSLLYYREKVSQCTEEEKDKRRQQWRDVTGNQTSPAKTRMTLTPAERQRKYRKTLKKGNPDKYEEFKKKCAASSLLYYKEKVSQCTEKEKEKRRQQWRDITGNQTSPAKTRMTLTPAERQRKYRERLKKENPDKYEEYKKKLAAKSLLYYREKASQYTEEEKEKRRQQWRDMRRNQTSTANKRMTLTPAERQKKYRESLKKLKPDKYEEYRKKSAARSLLYYRERASQYTEEEKEKRRQQWRDARRNQTSTTKKRITLTPAERQKKYREKLKKENPDKYEEYKKKTAARALLYNREKSSQYTEEEEERRQQCRRNRTSPAKGRMPLTSAERQKKYRERLKKVNPEKYEEIKKKVAENAKRYYIKKACQFTENGTEKSIQNWEDATIYSSDEGGKEIQEMKKTVNSEKGIASITQTTQNGVKKIVRKRLAPAERQRRYREKLDKNLEINKKSADNSKRNKENVSDASLKTQRNYVRGKILSSTDRVRKYRERLKQENPAKYAELMKKTAEAAKRYYREKAKLYTEEERELRRQKWREARRLGNKKQNERWKHKQDETQSSKEQSSSEEDAQPGPSERPMTPPCNSDSPDISDNSKDPLLRLTDQCRFCGQYSEDCLIVSSHMPYLAGNTTTLSLNDISLQLDFNDGLPKVCSNCDNKLQEYCNFIKAVKTAQETMLRSIKTETEDVSGIEDAVIKTETPDEEDNSISISDTEFVKNTVIHCYKRKGDATKQKAKVAKNVESENESSIDIRLRQEIDDNENIDSSRHSDAGSETLSIPDELKSSYSEIADETLSVSEVIKKESIESDTTVNPSEPNLQIVSRDLT